MYHLLLISYNCHKSFGKETDESFWSHYSPIVKRAWYMVETLKKHSDLLTGWNAMCDKEQDKTFEQIINELTYSFRS